MKPRNAVDTTRFVRMAKVKTRDHPPPRHHALRQFGRRVAGIQLAEREADDAGQDQQRVDRADGDVNGRREEILVSQVMPCVPSRLRARG